MTISLHTKGRILGGSYLAFGFILISLLWGDRWLPRTVGLAVLVAIIVGWLISAYLFFRHERFKLRQQIIGWAVVFAVIGFTVTREFSHYAWFHSSWDWILWDAVGISLILAAAGIASLVLPRRRSPTPAQYSVETETPEHVIRVGDASSDVSLR